MSKTEPGRLQLREWLPDGEEHGRARFEARSELHFEAGQWINLHVQPPGAERDARALSFCSAPSALPMVEICVRARGPSSVVPALAEGIGREFEFDGPYGAFRRTGAFERPSLFVASSTGLAPIRGMLEDGLAAASPGSLRGVLLHARGADRDVPFRDEVASWQERWPGLRCDFLEAGCADEADPACWNELLEAARGALGDFDRGEVEVWLAGHAGWIKPLRAELREQWQLDRRQVKAEIFWP